MMKTVLLIPAMLITLMTGFTAQASIIHLRTYNEAPVVVYLNGQLVGEAANRHHLKNVPAGQRYIEVIRLWYSPHHPMPKEELLLGKMVTIPAHQEIFAMLTPSHRLHIERRVALHPPTPAWQCPQGCPGHCSHAPAQQVVYNQPPARQPMSPADFQMLRHAIANQWFDSSRREVAIQAIGANYFTAMQVRELLDLFTFESTRLEIAKYAYDATLDPQRYFLVSEAFTFSSSVDELAGFVAMK